MSGSDSLPAPVYTALHTWREHLGRTAPLDEPVLVAWAPGRVNLIGEHTDYNDGWVLPAAVDRVIAVAGQSSREPFATLYSAHHDGHMRFPTDISALLAEQRRRLPLWARYVRATLTELAQIGRWQRQSGFVAAIAGDVPVGGGMSSSAALEVACATFELALSQDTMEPLEVARLCQRAEWRGAGARVGIMDQATSCLGKEGQAILLDCRSLDYTFIPVDLPDVRLLVFNTGAPHTLAASGYNERRAQCEEAVTRLAGMIAEREPGRVVTALRDVTKDDLDDYGASLPGVLLKRARHVIEENTRTLAAVEALRARDVRLLGDLFNQSHESLRDLYQVSCPELDTAVAIAREVPGVYGARMIGAGFGGSILALVRADAVVALEEALELEYPRRTGRRGQAVLCRIGGGAQWRSVLLDRMGNPAL
jgi:galactokinase